MASAVTSRSLITHLLALGAGWAGVALFYPAAPGAPVAAVQEETGKRPRAELAEAPALPQKKAETTEPRLPWPPPSGISPAAESEARAAASKDLCGDLDAEFAKVQARQNYDYVFTRALVKRWLQEDPQACLEWLGKMDSRIGWGDPYGAFAEALPTLQALDAIESGWLDANRKRALDQIAEVAGGRPAAELLSIVARLKPAERRSFLNHAQMRGANAEDAAIWLQLAGQDRIVLDNLVRKWLPPSLMGKSASDWQTEADLVLAAVAGHPAEAAFREKYETAVLAIKEQDSLAHLSENPAAAVASLEEVYRSQGLDDAEVRKKMMEKLSGSSGAQLNNGWNRAEWGASLQQAVMGKVPLRDAVESRLAGIDREMPEILRAQTRVAALKEAMVIEPATVIELSMSRGLSEEGLKAAAAATGDSSTPLAARAEILGSLAGYDMWRKELNFPEAKDFATRYFEADPEAAQKWRRGLPPALATSLEEVMR